MCAHVAYLYVAILNCVEYSHKCILYAMHMLDYCYWSLLCHV